jgi:hypothetical protein
MASQLYDKRTEQDEDARNSVPGYASIGVDDEQARSLRDGVASKLQDYKLATVGPDFHRLPYHLHAIDRGSSNMGRQPEV